MKDPDIADVFSSFFLDKVENLSSLRNYVSGDLHISESDEFELYSESEIGMAIDKLKRSKAQGFDEIPGNVIKDLKLELTRPLCWLFNSISESMHIPKSWKISRVVPILKKGNPKEVFNYRPMSNVSSLSKIFERCVLNKLTQTVGIERLFGTHQHRFSASRSTTTAALTLQDNISGKLDSNKVVLMYSADLSAAFDMLMRWLEIC